MHDNYDLFSFVALRPWRLLNDFNELEYVVVLNYHFPEDNGDFVFHREIKVIGLMILLQLVGKFCRCHDYNGFPQVETYTINITR